MVQDCVKADALSSHFPVIVNCRSLSGTVVKMVDFPSDESESVP